MRQNKLFKLLDYFRDNGTFLKFRSIQVRSIEHPSEVSGFSHVAILHKMKQYILF